MIRRIVLQLIAMGLLLVGGIAMFQDRLLYFPEPLALPALLAEAQRDGLRRWPAERQLSESSAQRQPWALAAAHRFHKAAL